MKKLIVFAVLLFGPAMTQQAAACDMGAIETWVASACNGNTCGTQPTSQQPARGCDGSNCTKFQPAASKVGCAGSGCVTDAPAQSARLQPKLRRALMRSVRR